MITLSMKHLLAVLLLCASTFASGQWMYRSTNDAMRGGKTRFAELNSTNRVNLAFPYGGGTKLQLSLYRRPDSEFNLVFWTDRGQLPCLPECTVVTRFDDDEVKTWAASGPDSGRSDALYIDKSEEFLERLRTSKKLFVEVSIYDYGKFQFVFSPRGLKWE